MKKTRENNKKDLPVLTAGDFILRMANRISESAMSAYAGQAAYMMILSFFPFLLFLLILVPYTPLDANYLITAIENFIPHTFQGVLTSLVSEVYQSNASNAVTIISLTVITMIWLSSKACMSLMIGLDRIYKVEITVPEKGRIARFSRRIPEANAVFAVLLWIYKRLAAMLYTVVFAVLRKPALPETSRPVSVSRTRRMAILQHAYSADLCLHGTVLQFLLLACTDGKAQDLAAVPRRDRRGRRLDQFLQDLFLVRGSLQQLSVLLRGHDQHRIYHGLAVFLYVHPVLRCRSQQHLGRIPGRVPQGTQFPFFVFGYPT